MIWLKNDLPRLITLVVGVVVLADKFFAFDPLHGLSTWFLQYGVLFAAFAMILGAANLLRVSAHKIRAKKQHWQYNYVLMIAIIGYTLLGLFAGTKNPLYLSIYNSVYVPAQATIISFMAFWLASACYRAFRARNLQAVILLVAGVTVMLGKIGIGSVIWEALPGIAGWIQNVPQSAVMRSLGVGIAIGMVGVGLRTIVGIERGFVGGGDES